MCKIRSQGVCNASEEQPHAKIQQSKINHPNACENRDQRQLTMFANLHSCPRSPSEVPPPVPRPRPRRTPLMLPILLSGCRGSKRHNPSGNRRRWQWRGGFYSCGASFTRQERAHAAEAKRDRSQAWVKELSHYGGWGRESPEGVDRGVVNPLDLARPTRLPLGYRRPYNTPKRASLSSSPCTTSTTRGV